MKEEIVILQDSPHAAEIKTVSGWVSRHGRFFGNGPEAERLARFDGATHAVCKKCGALTEKYMEFCGSCESQERVEKMFDKLEKRLWDGKTPLLLFDDDRFFWDADALVEFCLDTDTDIREVRLLICEPAYALPFSTCYWESQLPDEEHEIPSELTDAVEAFNKAIVACKEPLSWHGGKYAAVLSEDVLKYYDEELKEASHA